MRILIADDEQIMRQFAVQAFKARGFLVREAGSIEEIYELLLNGTFDLIILDRNFTNENEDAISVVREVRKKGNDVPILILSAIKGSKERSRCLQEGADDYLEKHYDLNELMARADALLRRRNKALLPNEIENFKINDNLREISLNDEVLPLKLKEFQLLKYFLYNQDRVITEGEILERVWDDDTLITRSNTVNVHVMRIRKALKEEKEKIRTVRGTGFMFLGINSREF